MKNNLSYIYGVSHVVYSTDELEESMNLFVDVGYGLKGKKEHSSNAPEKEAFLSGPMAETSDMILMSNDIFPDIEVKKENRISDLKTSSNYDYYVNYKGNTIGEFPAILKDLDMVAVTDSFNLFVQCQDPEKATALWKLFGMSVTTISDNLVLLTVGNLLSKKKTNIFYLRSNKVLSSWLDQSNVVCLSFLCSDIASTRYALAEMKYRVGDMFNISPFRKDLNVFFMRNNSGELYEFIAPVSQ